MTSNYSGNLSGPNRESYRARDIDTTALCQLGHVIQLAAFRVFSINCGVEKFHIGAFINNETLLDSVTEMTLDKLSKIEPDGAISI